MVNPDGDKIFEVWLNINSPTDSLAIVITHLESTESERSVTCIAGKNLQCFIRRQIEPAG